MLPILKGLHPCAERVVAPEVEETTAGDTIKG